MSLNELLLETIATPSSTIKSNNESPVKVSDEISYVTFVLRFIEKPLEETSDESEDETPDAKVPIFRGTRPNDDPRNFIGREGEGENIFGAIRRPASPVGLISSRSITQNMDENNNLEQLPLRMYNYDNTMDEDENFIHSIVDHVLGL